MARIILSDSVRIPAHHICPDDATSQSKTSPVSKRLKLDTNSSPKGPHMLLYIPGISPGVGLRRGP